jgi:hypothetical protein
LKQEQLTGNLVSTMSAVEKVQSVETFVEKEVANETKEPAEGPRLDALEEERPRLNFKQIMAIVVRLL